MKALLCLAFLVCLASQQPATTGKPSKLGVFDGRTPCKDLAKMLDEQAPSDCSKIKWRLTLYVDSISRNPDSYELIGFMREKRDPLRGSWSIIKGSKEDPEAIIYELNDNHGKPLLFLLKGDDNVLFFLDSEMKHLVGNKDFSYALNRMPNK